MDEKMMQGEQKEDAMLSEIISLAQSGDPAAMPKIAEIAQQMMGAQEVEEEEIAASFPDKIMGRIKSNRGE